MDPIVEITSVAHGGDGIGRIEGQVCFVSGALPGDSVRVHITRKSKNALWGEIREVMAPSPHRVSVAAHGGAAWLHFAYPAQAHWKQQIVRDLLQRLGRVAPELEWREDPLLRLGYRTRAEFHGEGERFGFFAPGTHDVEDLESCPLSHARLNEALARLRPLRLKGSVTVTANPEGAETQIWTAFASRKLKHAFPEAQCSLDDGPRARFLFDGVPIVNGTFSQSSLLLNRLLLRTVHELTGQPDSLLDLYCGNGNLSLGFAGKARVVGFDHNRFAVEAARELGTADYRTGDEGAMIKAISKGGFECVVLDPPRTGAKALMPALAQCGGRSIVYVSCDPATLARDVRTLSEANWRVERAAVIDLFPNTPHVETVCRLKREARG